MRTNKKLQILICIGLFSIFMNILVGSTDVNNVANNEIEEIDDKTSIDLKISDYWTNFTFIH